MIDAVGVPPAPGGTGSLLARLALPSLVGVAPLLLSRFLLLMALLLAGFPARLLVGLFWAMYVHAGLLAVFILTAMFVAEGAFLLPVAGV